MSDSDGLVVVEHYNMLVDAAMVYALLYTLPLLAFCFADIYSVKPLQQMCNRNPVPCTLHSAPELPDGLSTLPGC